MNSLSRGMTVKKNIFLMALFKGLSVGLTFLLVPILIHHIGASRYGAWVTLLSVFSWISLIEVGIGNGLRNKLTECFSDGQEYLAKIHISTTYYLLAKTAFILIPLLMLAICLVDLNQTFSILDFSDEILAQLSLILVLTIGAGLIISPFKSIAYALQVSTVETLAQFVQQALFIIGLLILIFLSITDIRWLGGVYGVALLLTGLLFSIWLFQRKPDLFPRLAQVDTEKTRQMKNLGVGFFVIQIAGLIIYSTDNLIIAHILGTSQVTSYSVVMKLFMTINLLQVTIQTPLWSLYTDAYKKNDLVWIKRVLKKLIGLQIIFGVIIVGLAWYAQDIIQFWVGDEVQIPEPLIWVIAAYTFILLWNNLYSYLLNGISKIRLGTIVFALAALINIPLSIYFAKGLHMGAAGVALGTICSILPTSLIGPVQVYYFIYTKHRSRTLKMVLS